MNKCPPEEKLGAYLDGELLEPEAAAVGAHVAACAACADEVAAFRELDGLAASLPTPKVSDAEWQASWAAISSRVVHARLAAGRRVWRGRVAWLAAAAASVAVVAGAWLIHQGPALQPPGQARECVVDDVEAGPGYNAMASYSPEEDVAIITVWSAPPEEAPSNGANGGVL